MYANTVDCIVFTVPPINAAYISQVNTGPDIYLKHNNTSHFDFFGVYRIMIRPPPSPHKNNLLNNSLTPVANVIQ